MGREMGRWFKREGTYVYLWLIHIVVWQKPNQFCKTIILKINKQIYLFFLKQRSHFSNKVQCRQIYPLPVVMYRCENWTIKKAECQGIDAFISSSVVLKKTLESPLDSKESKPVNPKGN